MNEVYFGCTESLGAVEFIVSTQITYHCNHCEILCITCNNINTLDNLEGGHLFMTFTRRGRVRPAQVGACGQEERGSAPCGHPQSQLEPTDIILSSSHAKKFSFLYQNYVFERNKKM